MFVPKNHGTSLTLSRKRLMLCRPESLSTPRTPRVRTRLLAMFLLVAAMGGCAPTRSSLTGSGMVNAAPLPCRQLQILGGAPGADSLRWGGTLEDDLEPWCLGVGPAAAYGPTPRADAVQFSDLAVVTWNVHGGGGDVDALIRDLRAGQLDGQPTESFVLLLQEAFRSGPAVPAELDSNAKGSRRVAPDTEDRQESSIEALAHRNGLHLLYVPSLRNGGSDDPPEDRGNAILSTLPLSEWEALELPLERQRRVAVAARIQVTSRAGEKLRVRFVNVHFDLRSPWRRFYRSLGAARAEQAKAVVERFQNDSVVVVGGDLNTWFGGTGEEAARIMRRAFPQPGKRNESRTVSAPGPLPDLLLDHLFFRLPPDMSASYQVVENRYGSDHFPVLGRISEEPPLPVSNRPPKRLGDHS